MFSSLVQPETVSLFSSTGSDPLQLFTTNTDPTLPADSFVHLLHDATSLPLPSSPRVLLTLPEKLGALDQTVLHIQSPTVRTTYVSTKGVLGLRHEWMHIQVRNAGREWAVEVGVVDSSGREGVVRCSTFQKQPRLTLSSTHSAPPLLHLPLALPALTPHTLTPWCTLSLHLPSLLPHFSTLTPSSPVSSTGVPIPRGRYAHTSYVRVYATCRVRRVWLSERRGGEGWPWEFGLFGVHGEGEGELEE